MARPRDDDDWDDDDDRPRRKKRRYHDDDDYDDRPSRRRSVVRDQGGVSPVIFIVGGLVLLGLIGGGIGIYFAFFRGDSKNSKSDGGGSSAGPSLTADKLAKCKTDMPLADIEAIIGKGEPCNEREVQQTMDRTWNSLKNSAALVGVVKWSRWKDGGVTLFIGVDGRNVARAAASYREAGGGRYRQSLVGVNTSLDGLLGGQINLGGPGGG